MSNTIVGKIWEGICQCTCKSNGGIKLLEVSNTLRYINLGGLVIGLVVLFHLGVCVSEERGDGDSSRGEGPGSQVLSDTLRYINLVGFAIGLVALCGPMHLRACVIEEPGDGEGAESQVLSDALRYINLVDSSIVMVTLLGPIHLCACLNEEWGRGGFEQVCLLVVE
jgi:hypothetical protein